MIETFTIKELISWFWLNHFKPMIHPYTLWKCRKTRGFLTFSGVIDIEYWRGMGYLFNLLFFCTLSIYFSSAVYLIYLVPCQTSMMGFLQKYPTVFSVNYFYRKTPLSQMFPRVLNASVVVINHFFHSVKGIF